MATKTKKTTTGTKARTTAKSGTSARKNPVQPSVAAKEHLSGTKADAAIDAAIAPVVHKPSPDVKSSDETPNDNGMKDVVQDGGLPVNKKEMIVRVAKRLGMRPNQVRDVTEAALAELGAALSAGEELKLPSLGKMQVKRKKDIGDAEIMICKLRRKKVENSGVDPLAPAAE